MVQARAPSNQHCGDRLVHLSNKQGRLSGAVAFARASVPIRNLMLLPDGSFSGATRARLTGSKLGRSYRVSGKFDRDTVSLTLESNGCPPLATASQLDRRQMAESGRRGSRFADHVQTVSRNDGPRAAMGVPAITQSRNKPVEPNTRFGSANSATAGGGG